MDDRDPSSSISLMRLWGAVEQQLREYVRETGEVTIPLTDLIPLCRSATIKAERWVRQLEWANYLVAGESLARQLQQSYHRRHRSPPRINGQEQYSVAQLRAIADTFVGEALRELIEQSRGRG